MGNLENTCQRNDVIRLDYVTVLPIFKCLMITIAYIPPVSISGSFPEIHGSSLTPTNDVRCAGNLSFRYSTAVKFVGKKFSKFYRQKRPPPPPPQYLNFTSLTLVFQVGFIIRSNIFANVPWRLWSADAEQFGAAIFPASIRASSLFPHSKFLSDFLLFPRSCWPVYLKKWKRTGSWAQSRVPILSPPPFPTATPLYQRQYRC